MGTALALHAPTSSLWSTARTDAIEFPMIFARIDLLAWTWIGRCPRGTRVRLRAWNEAQIARRDVVELGAAFAGVDQVIHSVLPITMALPWRIYMDYT